MLTNRSLRSKVRQVKSEQAQAEKKNQSCNLVLIPSESSKNELKPVHETGKISSYKFISRLLEILNYDKIHHIVSWNREGSAIEIKNERNFIEEVLPMFFKHKNMSNFIRQLNMYDFKKVKNYASSGILAYCNPLFKRDSHHLTEISRKHTNIGLHTTDVPSIGKVILDENSHQKRLDTSTSKDNSYLRNINYLIKNLTQLEQKIIHLEKTNELLLDYNNEFTKCIASKTDYIARLESLIVLIFQNSFIDDNTKSQPQFEEFTNITTDSSSADPNVLKKAFIKPYLEECNNEMKSNTVLESKLQINSKNKEEISSIIELLNDTDQHNSKLLGTKRKLHEILKNEGATQESVIRSESTLQNLISSIKSKDAKALLKETKDLEKNDHRENVDNKWDDMQINLKLNKPTLDHKSSSYQMPPPIPHSSSTRLNRFESGLSSLLIKNNFSFASMGNTTADNLFDKTALHQNSNLSSSNPFNYATTPAQKVAKDSRSLIFPKPANLNLIPDLPQPAKKESKTSVSDFYFTGNDVPEDEDKKKENELND